MEELYLNREKMIGLLPHRDPILLVDTATVQPGESAKGALYLNPVWLVFKGHFPDDPVLPGTYLIESMAQTADLILLSMPEYQGKLPLFLGVTSMRFVRAARPGDTLQTRAELMHMTEDGLADFRVSAFVDEKRVAAGQLSIALR